jgi:hypothetical protein
MTAAMAGSGQGETNAPRENHGSYASVTGNRQRSQQFPGRAHCGHDVQAITWTTAWQCLC